MHFGLFWSKNILITMLFRLNVQIYCENITILYLPIIWPKYHSKPTLFFIFSSYLDEISWFIMKNQPKNLNWFLTKIAIQGPFHPFKNQFFTICYLLTFSAVELLKQFPQKYGIIFQSDQSFINNLRQFYQNLNAENWKNQVLVT